MPYLKVITSPCAKKSSTDHYSDHTDSQYAGLVGDDKDRRLMNALQVL